jgi:hypothetical protein
MRIVAELADCAARDVPVHLIKVRSHTGLLGNDNADEGAGKVARGEEVEPRVSEPAERDPFSRLFWLKRRDDDFYVSDLNRGITNSLSPETHNGYTNKTKMTERWNALVHNFCPKTSNAYLTGQRAEPWLIKQILYARYGYLFNAKLKKRYGMGGDGNCPLCHQADSGGHILGGCSHRTMKGMHINRHNTATQLIAECLHNGSHGGGLLVMDATAADALPHYCYGNRPPTWMLPRSMDPNLARKLRPDILFMPTLPQRLANSTRYRHTLDKSEHPVYIIEVGYTADLNHVHKREDKTEQHRQLVDILRNEGWTVHYTPAETVILGTTGTIPTNLKTLLTTLGATPGDATKCCTHLHKHAVDSVGHIVRCRRRLEAETQTGRRPTVG